MRRLALLAACVALAGCGGSDDNNRTTTPTPTKVDAKVDLDRTIEDLDGTQVHLTGARTSDSIPGVELPDGGRTDVWIVIDMTVTAKRHLTGSVLRPEMSIVGGNGESPINDDAEKALPNGLTKATIPPGKPTDASVVFVIDRARLNGAKFSYAGDIVALGL